MPDDGGRRVVILGGGFGGVYTALHLERLLPRGWDIVLVNRDNYFLMTPLLFEAGSGVLEPRHSVNPIRPLLTRARFIEGEIEAVDVDRRVVTARHAPGLEPFELRYDHVVFALGGVTNKTLIPGSEHALTFKTLADAIFVRNQIIDLLERADIEPDPERRRTLLTFVVVGAGLVGVELIGELTEFVRVLRKRSYARLLNDPLTFHLVEAGPNVLPELERGLADHAVAVLQKRGVRIRTGCPVQRVESGRLILCDGSIVEASTIVLATGVSPNPLLAQIDVPKDRKGRIDVEPTMRIKGRADAWALGDCASIPDPDGKPYPPLAQHALRQAKVLAGNIAATIAGHGALQPFVYESLGTLAALGHYSGVGRVLTFRLRGFAAWWVWRTYYLFQMPRWERRLRIMLDWTVALLFKNDVVKLDLFGEQHPLHKRVSPGPQSGENTSVAREAAGARS